MIFHTTTTPMVVAERQEDGKLQLLYVIRSGTLKEPVYHVIVEWENDAGRSLLASLTEEELAYEFGQELADYAKSELAEKIGR